MSESVAIFWDYENCELPSAADGYAVARGITRIAHQYGSVKTFKAYLEISEQTSGRSLALRSELTSCGVSITDCPHNGRKDVADKMLIVDMLAYAMDTPAPATIILISGDRDFVHALALLRLRRYRVVVIAPRTGVHISLKAQASKIYNWCGDVLPGTFSGPKLSATVPPLSTSSIQASISKDPTITLSSSMATSEHSLSLNSSNHIPIVPAFPPSPLTLGNQSTLNEQDSSMCSSEQNSKSSPKDGIVYGSSSPVSAAQEDRCEPSAQKTPILPELLVSSAPRSNILTKSSINLNPKRMTQKLITQFPINRTSDPTSPSLLQNGDTADDINSSSSSATYTPITPFSTSISHPKPRIRKTRVIAKEHIVGDSQLRVASSPLASPLDIDTEGRFKSVPMSLKPLVDVLWRERLEGHTRVSSSQLGALLLRKTEDVYESAGVRRLKEYTNLAEERNVIVFCSDEEDGNRWISLHPMFHLPW